MKITIEYDPIERKLSISGNDFSDMEAFGILEAAKLMVANHWLFNTDAERGESHGETPGEKH